MLYALCFLLFMIGLYCAVVKKNLVKIVIGLAIMEYAVNLFLIMLGYRVGGTAPIIGRGDLQAGVERVTAHFVNSAVDPLPQALVLTSIVIGLSVVALMVVMALRLHQKYGTFDLTQITKLKG